MSTLVDKYIYIYISIYMQLLAVWY